MDSGRTGRKERRMRLIDADALKKNFPKDNDWEYPVNTNEYVCECIDAQPTVDAVPVVRCRDCINRYSSCPMITIHPDGSITFRAQDNWYCFMWKEKE